MTSVVKWCYNHIAMSNAQTNNSTSRKGDIPSPVDIKKNEIFKEYARYFAMPDPDKCEYLGIPFNQEKRKYESQPTDLKFAAKHGVHRTTLHLWRKRDDFRKLVENSRSDWGKSLTPNVLAALYKRCVKMGMAYDVELWLAYVEGWDRKQIIKHVREKFDSDDLRAIIAELPEDQQEEAYATIGHIITQAELRRSDS